MSNDTSCRIVVVDDIVLDAAQVDRLHNLGKVKPFEKAPSSEEETVARLADAEIAIVGWTDINPGVLLRLPALQMISLWATGYDYVDVETATKRGVLVTNVPGYGTGAVAEMVFGLVFAIQRKIILADRERQTGGGRWNWRYFPGEGLCGKTVGIVGTGNIGRRVAKLAWCFGARVLASTNYPSRQRGDELGVEYVDLNDLLRESDVVTLHAQLNKDTEGLIGVEQLAVMKPTAILINTARAELVNEKALAEALDAGKLAGAASDVTLCDSPLFRCSKAVLTPHIAWYTAEARKKKTDICLDNVDRFIHGSPQNVVNPEVLEARFTRRRRR